MTERLPCPAGDLADTRSRVGPPRLDQDPALQLTTAEALDAAFSGQDCALVHPDGRHRALATERWRGAASRDDLALLVEPCHGPTLDVGCGPGRLAAALRDRGVDVLGVDISREAVRQTRQRGVPALCRDVFDDLPGPGSWQHVLLADGNIGLGGEPERLLRRLRLLLAADGTVLVELAGPGELSVHENMQLHVGGRLSRPFAWATVGTDAIERVARSAGLSLSDVVGSGGRNVATLRLRPTVV